jgi:alkylation response protein AidB-like acyl-CoA dehydrogenase
MDFTLNADQKMILESAEQFLAQESDSVAVRRAMESAGGHDAALWEEIRTGLGWCGVAVPEAFGGMDLGQLERGLLMEEMGRRLACVPYLASACLATDALLHVAHREAQERYLPQLANGSLSAALVLPAPLVWETGACKISAHREGSAYVLNGIALQVPGAAQADLLLVPARLVGEADAYGLFAIPATAEGVQVTALPALDATRPVARVELRCAAVANASRIDPSGWSEELHEGLRRTCDLAALALAAEQVGGARQCLDLTLSYVNERNQFGRAIASFQAVKHRCAQMMIALESARSMVYGALRAAQTCRNPDRLALDVACAKAAASHAAFFCAQEAIQLHGGVGFTWEYDPQLYFKRANATRSWLSEDECYARIATHLCDAAEERRGIEDETEDSQAGFRSEVASWMQSHLQGEFAVLRHRGGPGDEEAYPELRKKWEQVLAQGGWTCVGWPAAHGGRALSVAQQVIFHEEYVRAGGPGRMGHIGEGLIGPTLIAYGTEDQKARFLSGIRDGSVFWCQGYSEPGAGSDLANVQTRAVRDEATGDWIVHGQKVWTSLAHESDWIFVLARCDSTTRGNRGLIFLLMPLNQPGIEIRPIRQISGSAEFNEVFFDGARAKACDVVGAPGEGWKIAMALLGFERGLSTLGQQMHFRYEFDMVVEAARANGSLRNPAIRRRLAQAWAGLRTMRYNALRMLSDAGDGQLRRETLIYKYYWSNWHRALGELAMEVLGTEANLLGADDGRRARLQGLFLFSRADTIYAGTNEIQLNIIAERGLGMPKEARVAA